MNDLKLSVKIILPGSMMFTQDEAEHLEKENAGKGFNVFRMKVVDKKGNSEWVHYRTRKYRPACQSINMTTEVYNYMRSYDSCPPSVKPFVWKSFTSKMRLEYHLAQICLSLGGKGFSYEVFED